MKRKPIINTYQDNQEVQENLVRKVNELMDKKKGVLGMDEHILALNYCFSLIDRINDWENRRLFRQFLTAAPLQEQFSAAIVSEEFMKQSDDEAIEFFDILTGKGLSLGVRLDAGMSCIFGADGEYIGTGMDSMAARFNVYKERGCIFSKWRCIFQIKGNSPSYFGTQKIVYRLAKFAAISQNHELVPIVSVEITPDGEEDIDKARRALEKLLIYLIKALNDLDVLIEATILQISFVQPGRMNTSFLSPENIADQTLEAFKKSLPVALGGVMFHSSGLSEELATQTLNHIIIRKEADDSMLPWRMTHSFGRAQKFSAIMTWRGDPEFEEAGQQELLSRGNANNKALIGKYEAGSFKGSLSDKDLFIPNYIF